MAVGVAEEGLCASHRTGTRKMIWKSWIQTEGERDRRENVMSKGGIELTKVIIKAMDVLGREAGTWPGCLTMGYGRKPM